MVRKTKWRSRIPALGLSALMGISVLGIPVAAETADATADVTDNPASAAAVEEAATECTLVVHANGVQTTEYSTDVVYPSKTFVHDGTLVLKLKDGSVYEHNSVAVNNTTGTRDYTFVLPIGVDFAGATVDFRANEYVESLTGLTDLGFDYNISTRELNSGASDVAINVTQEMTWELDEYGDPITTPNGPDAFDNQPRPDVPVDGSYEASVSFAFAGNTLNSVFIANGSSMDFDNNPYEDRDSSARTDITDVFCYDAAGNLLSHGKADNGVAYFLTPASQTMQIQLKVVGFVSEPEVFLEWSAFDTLDVSGEDGLSATYATLYWSDMSLDFRDVNEADDTISDDEDWGSLDLEDEGVSSYFSNVLNLNIDSTVADYLPDLIRSTDTYARVLGEATTKLLMLNMNVGIADGKAEWGTVSLFDKAAQQVYLDEGTYEITVPSIYKASGDTKVTIKSGEAQNASLKVEPRYTMQITSANQNIDFTVNGIHYKDLTGKGYIMTPDSEAIIVDAISGNTYRAVCTDENPHIKVTLGGTDWIQQTGTGTGTFEDVPNTSDAITIAVSICGGILVLLAATFGIVFMRNRKKNGG